MIVRTLGGASALVSAWLVGPRLGRWELTEAPPMGSPTNALIGLYMLWWGWLAFNAGSTFGSVIFALNILVIFLSCLYFSV